MTYLPRSYDDIQYELEHQCRSVLLICFVVFPFFLSSLSFSHTARASDHHSLPFYPYVLYVLVWLLFVIANL